MRECYAAGMAFSGVLAPVLTPFDAQLDPDLPRWLQLCRALLSEGCSGLAIFGTTSEANSLSFEERARMLEALVTDGVDARALMPGTGCCALPDTVQLTKIAVEAGCGGVLMLPPFYYKNPSEEGIYRNFANVIERVNDSRLRIYLYHIPQVSQVGFSLPLIERLRRAFPSMVVGIKDSSGDWNNTKAMLEACKGFEIFVGSEKFLLANLAGGGAGCITATANINAKAIARLFRERSQGLQDEVNTVRALLESRPLIAALKAVVAQRTGHPGWRRMRPPLVELSEREAQDLIARLA